MPPAANDTDSDRNFPNETSPPTAPPPPLPQVIVAPVVVVPVIVPVPVAVPAPSAEKLPGGNDFSDGEKGVDSSASVPAKNPLSPPPRVSAAGKFWRKIGGAGFLFSFLLHVLFIAFAIFFIVSEERFVPEAEAMFVSGSGGSTEARKSKGCSYPKPKPLDIKITTVSRTAEIVLPEMPKLATLRGNVKFSAAGGTAFGAGEGVGADAAGTAGFGGGIGAGTGVGIGGGKNHLGKFKTLLGAKIQAQRIAVYLDCSGSMKSFLPAVKAEIYEKFPDADIFAFSGAQTEVHDGNVVGGRSFKAKQLVALKRKPAADETETAKLSAQGKAIHKKHAAHFAAGTLGAWLDVLSRERYDALVVFSDFRDGVRQRRAGKTVFADSSYSPAPDSRSERERKWEAEWRGAFSRAGAPKLYLFSVRAQPQDFLEKCVSASGGEITVLNLKKRRGNGEF